jgi:ferredoxin-NADP reductase
MPIVYPVTKKYTAKVAGITYLNSITVKVDYILVEPSEIEFVPGQFISLSVGSGLFRSYSLCSDYKNKNTVSIALTVGHAGAGANYVKSLKTGDTSIFIGPSGRFTLTEKLPQELLFMATGTGISPIIAMLYQLEDINYLGKARLYFGLRTEELIFFKAILDEFKSKLKDFDYSLCISNPSATWQGSSGRITDFFKISDIAKVNVYVCGNPYMCSDVIKLLEDRGVKEKQIFHEKFTVSVR